MSKYLFAWELGQGLGHLVRYQGLVAKLLADGHEVYYAARNVERVREVNPQQALIVEEVRPEFRPKSERIINPRIASYATLLINCGFNDATRLAHRTRRWIECFERIQPDVFICDHSPTALFANRFLGVPVVLAGNSFTVPPSENPFRLYQYWRFEHSEQASAVEAQLTATVNAAQRKISSQAERMAHPSEILNAQRRWLLTFPEFDGYGERDDVRYFGTFAQPGFGAHFAWPKSPGPRVFVYLRGETGIREYAEWARQVHASTCIFARELSPGARGLFDQATTLISDSPLDFSAVLASAELAVTNGTSNTLVNFSVAGIPQLVIPRTIENAMQARRLELLGAGLSFNGTDQEKFTSKMNGLLYDVDYTRGAQRIAEKYSDQNAKVMTEHLYKDLGSVLA